MFIKFIALGFTAFAGVLTVLLDHWKPFSDKRTKWHRRGRVGLQAFLLLSVAASFYTVYLDDQASTELTGKLDDSLAKLRDTEQRLTAIKATLDKIAETIGIHGAVAVEPHIVLKAVEESKKELVEMRATLDEIAKTVGTKDRQKMIDTVRQLQAAVDDAQGKIKTLESKAIRAEKGVSESVDFNGAHRTTAHGRISVVGGTPEQNAYVQMSELEKKKDWAGLEREAAKTSSAFPSWLTPYLFLGVAKANLGKKVEAEKALKHVVDNAHGDPDYAHAAKLLEQVRRLP